MKHLEKEAELAAIVKLIDPGCPKTSFFHHSHPQLIYIICLYKTYRESFPVPGPSKSNFSKSFIWSWTARDRMGSLGAARK